MTWSVVLGAAMPAAAGGSSTGDGSVRPSLDLGDTLGDTVDTVTGDADGTNASTNGDGYGPNVTETAESDNESVTRIIGETTSGLEERSTPTLEPTPEPGSDGGGVDQVVGETGETAAGESTPEETPAEADAAGGEDSSSVGTTADVVDDDSTGATETIDETVSGTTDAVRETTNATGRTVDNTAVDDGSAVDGTVGTATGNDSEPAGTADGVTDSTNQTVGSITRTGSSSESTGDLVADTAGGVTRTVDATAARTVDNTFGVTTTVDETVSSTTGLFDGGNGTVARLAGNVTSEVDAATGGLTAVVDDTARTVQRTTDAVTDSVDDTTGTTGQLVDGTVDGGVADGLFEPDGDGENTEAYGWPTEESGSSSDAGAVASGEGPRTEAADSAVPAQIASTQGSSSEGPDEPDADDAASSDGGGVLPSLDELDPAAGGAIVGALLVTGSVLATRAGMTASSTAAGAATLPQLLFAMLREFALRVAVLAGYSRYDFSDPLENENRATVLETVEASPGINLTSLVEETGLTQSTVRYHARVLEHEGLLDAAKVRGRRRFVPRSNEDVELVAAFEEEATRDVIDALFEHEPATGTTLAEALDRDPSTISHHLSRLSEAGLVEREQDGPALRNSLSADVRAALSDVEVTASVQQHVRADD